MKLTDKDKAVVITDYAAGKSKSEIAKKFNVSITAVSKILKNGKSLEKVQKFSKSSAELRKDIIRKATETLYEKDFVKFAPETLLKIIERLSILEPDNEGREDIKVVLSIEDVSGGSDETV